MTCKLCKGSGIVYGSLLSGTVCPVCGGTGTTDNMGTPAEKTLLDEFAIAALNGAMAGPSQTRINGRLCENSKDYALFSYDFAAAMMRERNRRDEMGNVKEATE